MMDVFHYLLISVCILSVIGGASPGFGNVRPQNRAQKGQSQQDRRVIVERRSIPEHVLKEIGKRFEVNKDDGLDLME